MGIPIEVRLHSYIETSPDYTRNRVLQMHRKLCRNQSKSIKSVLEVYHLDDEKNDIFTSSLCAIELVSMSHRIYN